MFCFSVKASIKMALKNLRWKLMRYARDTQLLDRSHEEYNETLVC